MSGPRISNQQYVTLALVFLTGTSTLLMPSEPAGRDMWMSVLIAAVGGLLATMLWTRLASRFPGRTPFGYAGDVLGPLGGLLVSAIFIAYFIQLGSLILRNVGELYSTVILTKTPPVVFTTTLAALSTWLVRAGLEPLARTGEVLGMIVAAVVVTLVILRFATPGLTHLGFLLPVLENGMGPVLRHALVMLAFPFAELVAFLFLVPAIAHPERAGRSLASAIVIGGSLLGLVSLSNLCSLGPTELARFNFPSLVTIRQIQLGQFFQRIEVLGILTWTSGSFMKLAVCHYVAVLGVAETFGLANPRPVAGPIAAIMATLSIAIYSNIAEMTAFAARAWPVYAPIIQVGLPLFMLVAAAVRGERLAPRAGGSSGPS